MPVTDKDNGYQALFARLKGAQGLVLTVGVHDSEGAAPEGETTVAQIATVHEYGLGNCPERSWLRAWFDEHQAENKGILRQVAEGALKGSYPPGVALDRAGLLFVAKIQQRIRGNIPPPLKDATAERKGSTVALINTGQFVSAIRHRVTGGK